MLESTQRIEPARIEDVPEAIADVVAEVAAAAAKLEVCLHPTTAANLAKMIRIMNTYYSNLIEGHNTRPKDIEAALALNEVWPSHPEAPPSTRQIEEALDSSKPTPRDFLLESVSHVRVQEKIDAMAIAGILPEVCSTDFLKWIHLEFYRDASESMLRIGRGSGSFMMQPGAWRDGREQDVVVGRHHPPASERVADFMSYFESRYQTSNLGKSARILAIAAAHHRFNYIHPFPDGNGRVSRLMSHAMAHKAGIGAHGLWSISRGLARGMESRSDYKRMMDHADQPRQGDLDGRGNLSQKALNAYCHWFLRVCLDQITFMTNLFQIDTLSLRLRAYVERHDKLKPEASRLLEEALLRGEFGRGEIARITGLPERSARRLFADVIEDGLLASETPKGPVSLRFPTKSHDDLFPKLFLQS